VLVCWNSSNRLNYPVSLAVRQSQVSKTINQSKLPNRFKNSRVSVKATFNLDLTLSATLCMIYKVAEHFILFMFYRNFLFFFWTRRRAVYLYIKKKRGKNPYNIQLNFLLQMDFELSCSFPCSVWCSLLTLLVGYMILQGSVWLQ